MTHATNPRPQNLAGTHLHHSNLATDDATGAELRGADLLGADLTGANLAAARGAADARVGGVTGLDAAPRATVTWQQAQVDEPSGRALEGWADDGGAPGGTGRRRRQW